MINWEEGGSTWGVCFSIELFKREEEIILRGIVVVDEVLKELGLGWGLGKGSKSMDVFGLKSGPTDITSNPVVKKVRNWAWGKSEWALIQMGNSPGDGSTHWGPTLGWNPNLPIDLGGEGDLPEVGFTDCLESAEALWVREVERASFFFRGKKNSMPFTRVYRSLLQNWRVLFWLGSHWRKSLL